MLIERVAVMGLAVSARASPRRGRGFRGVGRGMIDFQLLIVARNDVEPAKGAFDTVFDEARQGGMPGSAP